MRPCGNPGALRGTSGAIPIEHPVRRPNEEVVALLVVAPSKTDRERVIPMTAELSHVIATIIRRLTRNRRAVPLGDAH